MRTIAVTIDERTLTALDKFAKRNASRSSSRQLRTNRSSLVRAALHEFLARHARTERDAEEWRVWSQHLERINKEAAALVEEQADS